MVFESFDQTVKRSLSSIGDEARDRVVQIVFHSLQHTWHDGLAKHFSFLVNVGIVAPGEIDALKAAGFSFSRRSDLLDMGLSVATNDQR